MPQKKNGFFSSRNLRYVLPPAIAGVVLTISVALSITFTDQAIFCGSCHAMNEAVLTHSQSVHAQEACNECHIPHDITMLPFKAKIGLNDIFVNFTKTIPDMIHPGQATKRVTQANCERCHGATTSTVTMQSKEFCTDCHRHVPHTPKKPVAYRSAADA